MSTEMPFSPENPRTGISFFDQENRDYIARADVNNLVDLLAIKPSHTIPVMHECWRIGREKVYFDVMKRDQGQRAFWTLESGEFLTAITTLYAARNEAYQDCLDFVKESLYMIDKARTGRDLGDLTDPIKLRILDSQALNIMDRVKIEKDRYYSFKASRN